MQSVTNTYYSIADNTQINPKVYTNFQMENFTAACQAKNISLVESILNESHFNPYYLRRLLAIALKDPHPTIIELLLKKGANPSQEASLGCPLEELFKNFKEGGRENFEKIALMLLSHGADVSSHLFDLALRLNFTSFMEAIKPKDRLKAFAEACLKKDLAFAKLLLNQPGLNTDTLNEFLSIAIQHGLLEVIKLILEKEVDPNYQLFKGVPTMIALFLFPLKYSLHEAKEIALLLIDKGAKFSSSEILACFEKGFFSVVQAFIQKNPTDLLVVSATNSTVSTAYRNNDWTQMTLLFSMGRVNEQDPDTGETFLHFLLRDKNTPLMHYATVKNYVEKGMDVGANPDLPDHNGVTPRQLAAQLDAQFAQSMSGKFIDLFPNSE